MDILVTLGLILLGSLFYCLSYITPRTDVLMYGLSAIFFLVGGVLGMVGYTDVYLPSNDEVITETQINNSTSVKTVEHQKEEVPFLNLLPAIFLLFSIYQLSVIAVEFKNGQ